MRTQRIATSAVRGYSAWSMKLRCRLASITARASGSIQVVTKVARFFSGLRSSRVSEWTMASAERGSIDSSGSASSRRCRVKYRSKSVSCSANDGVGHAGSEGPLLVGPGLNDHRRGGRDLDPGAGKAVAERFGHDGAI